MEPRSNTRTYIVSGAVLAVLVIALFAYLLYAHSKPIVAVNPEPVIATPIATAPAAPAQSSTTVDIPEPTPLPEGTDRFVVSLSETNDAIAADLFGGNYITDAAAFTALLGTKTITPGAYKISTAMTPAQLVQTLTGKPYMVWVVIPEGLRKEEIADLLKSALGWSKSVETKWITTDTTKDPNYSEGVYFPNTYLIPLDTAPVDVATRLVDKFNEVFAPALAEFTKQNIKWTTGLTLASIVQREAANDADMPLIAGILWNRLNQKMPLDVDATLQYARGNTGAGWWAPISVADKKIDSPYNTYTRAGLPPRPISNPGISAINAVLNPAETDCIYYLHDKDHVTHCAVTYEEHQANIEKYLKDAN